MDVKVVVIVILALASIAFLIWALLVQSKFDSRAANIIQNPYCLRVGCADGNLPQAYMLTPQSDPQRVGYQTLNWCVVNAPPTQFVRSLQNCNSGNGYAAGSDEYKLLEQFINWYPFQYMPTCGNSFKQPVAVADGTAPGNIGISPLANPQSPEYINSPCNYTGPNDDAGFFAYICASKDAALRNTAGYAALADIFGPLTECYGV